MNAAESDGRSVPPFLDRQRCADWREGAAPAAPRGHTARARRARSERRAAMNNMLNFVAERMGGTPAPKLGPGGKPLRAEGMLTKVG